MNNVSSFDFRFDLPVTGWQDQSIYTFKGPTVDEMDHYLYLALDRDIQNATLEQYADVKVNIILSSLEKIKILSDASVSLQAVFARELILKWSPAIGVSRYKKYLFVVEDGIGFTFNCDFTQKSFSLVADQMTAIVAHLVQK